VWDCKRTIEKSRRGGIEKVERKLRGEREGLKR
jgi:hypothetical protein